MSVFAQGEPGNPTGPEKPAVYLWKITVYAQGASDAGINKSFSSKLLSAIAQSGKYAEIGDWETFYKELSKSPEVGIGQIAGTAAQHGADVVCAISLTEAFGAYSISARLVKTSDSQVLKTISLDRSLNSLDDLTIVSNELAVQLLGIQSQQPAPPPSGFLPPVPPAQQYPGGAMQQPAAEAPVPQNECTSKFNINELVSKIQSGFPATLKDCSATLAKDIALSKSPFGKKTPLKEPKSFMTDCAIDGIKQKLPSGADEYIKPVESFVQNILNAASAAGGGLDVAKLSSAIGGMNVMDLINDLKIKAANDACVSSEPYTPVEAENESGGGDSGDDGDRKILSFGLRFGVNLSHLYADYRDRYTSSSGTYSSTLGFQAGLLLDIAASNWFHIQPGVEYIQKGMEDFSSSYIEIPLLLSLKFAAVRINAGPYIGICLDSYSGISCNIDYGVSTGLGFDIGMFYIGAFYDYGLTDVSDRPNFDFYNRTLGFNLGINL